MINERAIATRDTQNFHSRELCYETCTTGNKGNCVGGRIFILRSYCEVYRKFTRVLIVEIIFQQDGIDRRGD